MAQKKLEKYPYEYHRLFLRAKHEGQVKIACEDYPRAHNVRNDLYAFRRALVLDEHELVDLARSLVLSIERDDNGCSVVVQTLSTPNHKHITEALGDNYAEPTTEPGKTS